MSSTSLLNNDQIDGIIYAGLTWLLIVSYTTMRSNFVYDLSTGFHDFNFYSASMEIL